MCQPARVILPLHRGNIPCSLLQLWAAGKRSTLQGGARLHPTFHTMDGELLLTGLPGHPSRMLTALAGPGLVPMGQVRLCKQSFGGTALITRPCLAQGFYGWKLGFVCLETRAALAGVWLGSPDVWARWEIASAHTCIRVCEPGRA